MAGVAKSTIGVVKNIGEGNMHEVLRAIESNDDVRTALEAVIRRAVSEPSEG